MTIRQDGDIRLCPVSAGEIDIRARWMRHGEWLLYDAPWEPTDEPSVFREKFLQAVARQEESVSRCTIYHKEDPIGSVSAYDPPHDKTSIKVGIDICEDSYLGKGFGTRSLSLWIDYWFVDRKVHRVGLETWSFNGRMLRVAEKCGFVAEGVEREALRWNGAWQSMHHFGMIEDEYARIRTERSRKGEERTAGGSEKIQPQQG
jgi:RimJ/RimL family protein N-acetyltransferase